jgi:hypothetical protein
MFFSKSRVVTLSSPKVGILDLGGEDTKQLVKSDTSFLRPLFDEVQAAESTAPKCDVLFLYAKLTAEGAVLGSTRSLREIIRDSGAKVVVVAIANQSGPYIKAGKQQPYGRANLVMTLNRRGDNFGRFFEALFSRMKEGRSMSAAWVELNPQVPGSQQADCPEMIFACEIGALAFG